MTKTNSPSKTQLFIIAQCADTTVSATYEPTTGLVLAIEPDGTRVYYDRAGRRASPPCRPN